MKYLIPFLICFLGYVPLSLAYVPFPTGPSEWQELRIINSGIAGTSVLFKYTTRMERDTMINGKSYKVIETRWDLTRQSHSYLGTTVNLVESNFKTLGAIREEDQKVYFYNFGNFGPSSHPELTLLSPDTDNLIYDFNVNVGDTLYWKPSIGEDYSILLSTDSVSLENGDRRKRYNFGHHGFVRDTWIEGLGSTDGLFGSVNDPFITGYAAELFCASVNGEVVYDDKNRFDGCNTIFKSDEQEPYIYATDFQLDPNPFNEKIVVRLKPGEVLGARLDIYSVDKHFFRSYFFGRSSEEIDTSDFPRGIYVAFLYDHNDGLLLDKIMIKY